jgi:hypothetical protein
VVYDKPASEVEKAREQLGLSEVGLSEVELSEVEHPLSADELPLIDTDARLGRWSASDSLSVGSQELCVDDSGTTTSYQPLFLQEAGHDV